MSVDQTEPIRRKMAAEINTNPKSREELEDAHGRVWTTDELREDFEVSVFSAPFVIVKSRTTGKLGSLMFQHSPRFFFEYTED